MLTLDIAIATHTAEGIYRVERMLLPSVEGVRYIVSWQDHDNAPIPESISSRKDVNIYRFEESGVSRNRNNAISHCNSDIVLIADDDVFYKVRAFKRIIESFEKKPEMDFALYRIKFPIEKKYPAHSRDISLPFPKGYYGSAVEMAFRRNSIGNLKFWGGIGPGTNYLQAGEDELFLISAIKRGLKVEFFDLEIGEHPTLSSGNKVTSGILRGQGFIIRQIYPYSFALRIPLKAFRLWKSHKTSFFPILISLFQGSFIKYS